MSTGPIAGPGPEPEPEEVVDDEPEQEEQASPVQVFPRSSILPKTGKVRVACRVTDSVQLPGGVVNLVAGRVITVPVGVVSDLRMQGLIHEKIIE